MKRKPVVGETLYRLRIRQVPNKGKSELVPVLVTFVGRKYFKCRPINSVSQWEELEFYIETWLENAGGYSASYQIYETETERLDEIKCGDILSELRALFSVWGPSKLTLQQLRDIKAIIDQPKEGEE